MERDTDDYEIYEVYVEGFEEKPYATKRVKIQRADEEALERNCF